MTATRIYRCVICGKKVTRQFKTCAECEEEWGRRVDDRPEWLTEMINDEERQRYWEENNQEVQLNDSDDGFSYYYDIEDLIEAKADYAGFSIDDSDGYWELQDSDWDSVLTWSW